MTERRKIVAVARMPERLTRGDIIANVDRDVREATGALRTELTNKALTLSANGFRLDEESWEIAVNGRIVVGTAVIER